MKNFRSLRQAAGFDRQTFIAELCISERTLCDYDNDRREPPIVLIRYLRLLANGCKLCPLAKHNAATIHKAE
ncbi:MAG: hypothetical protein IJS15_08135 [Victivallales bacterium]|nr:hypothetical protein [Victivallales bacterium]